MRKEGELEKDMERLRKKLIKKQCKVKDLAQQLNTTERTVYRWIQELQEQGVPVVRGIGYPAKYRILSV